jgi:hypothetical protein
MIAKCGPDIHRIAGRKGYAAGIARCDAATLDAARRKGYANGLAKRDPAQHRADSRKGYEALIARYGPEALRAAGRRRFQQMIEAVGAEQAYRQLAARLAERPPTDLERTTHLLLQQLGLCPGSDYLTQQVVGYLDAAGTQRYTIVDVLGVRTRFILEPGHTLWHGGPDETLDGQDHAARDQCRKDALTRANYSVLLLTEHDLHPARHGATRERVRALIAGAPTADLPDYPF